MLTYNYDEITCGTNVLPDNDIYQKDAKAFIRAIKKRALIIDTCRALRTPIAQELGYTELEIWTSNDKELQNKYNTALKLSSVKQELDNLSRSHLNLNRRLEKLKVGYWACYPKGCEEYYGVYPNLTRI